MKSAPGGRQVEKGCADRFQPYSRLINVIQPKKRFLATQNTAEIAVRGASQFLNMSLLQSECLHRLELNQALITSIGVEVGLSCVSAPSVSARTTQKFSNVCVPPLIFMDLRKPRSFIWGGDAATALPRRLTLCIMRTANLVAYI